MQPKSSLAGVDLCRYTATEVLADQLFVDEWRSMVATAYPQVVPFNSPEWIGHLAEQDSDSILVWAVRSRDGSLLGVVPFTKRDFQLTFDVANRVFARIRFKVAEVLGSPLCIPADPNLFEMLVADVLGVWADCDGVCFDALPSSDPFADLLQSLGRASSSWRVYSPSGPRPWHLITLETTFEDYLHTMSAKTRATLRRKVRQFERTGNLFLQRYTDAADVLSFLDGVCQVSRNSWQQRLLGHGYKNDDVTRKKFSDLASRGLLRGYVLWRDSSPCAYLIGYQHLDIYYYADVGFDPALAEFSPGTVLLFLALQDLHEHRRPAMLNFGVGDASYKRRFGTDVRTDETFLVLRARLVNRMATVSHRSFMTVLDITKKLVGRRVRN